MVTAKIDIGGTLMFIDSIILNK